ncbi:hypothetical protein IAD21_05006 [Abditibacteriota bacterium]|nr:hypothetical protein IAD21_05006 [Abditibacteriota bacterium]
MSFKQQLRDWLGGLWHDFWHVPYRQVLGFSGVALLTITWAVWRTRAATDPGVRASFHAFSPVLLLLLVLLVFFAVPRRIS